MYNRYTDSYEDFDNTNGDSYWDIGCSGFFMKEIELPREGSNKLRIVAYNKNDSELGWGTNLQVNNFAITLLDLRLKDALKYGLFRFTDFFNQMFDRGWMR